MKFLIIFTIFLKSFNFILGDFCEETDLSSRIFSPSSWDEKKDSEFLQHYIKKLYQGNIKFSDDVLDFIEHLDSLEQKTQGFKYLFDEITSSEDYNRIEFMRFVNLINQYYDENVFDENISYIRRKIPEHILNFPWNDVVKIKNKHFGQSLYAVNDTSERFNLDNKRRLLSVSTASDSDKGFFWELHQNENGTIFKLYNVNLKQYLCADTSRYDGFRRNVILYKTEKPDECYDEWEIEPFEGTRSFRIKNIFWDEYLYAFDSASVGRWERKLTYLWRTFGCDGDQCAWDFQSVN